MKKRISRNFEMGFVDWWLFDKLKDQLSSSGGFTYTDEQVLSFLLTEVVLLKKVGSNRRW